MDQNNMNKFFNSSFFAQTPQKDNKQAFPTQQPLFGQQASGFGQQAQGLGQQAQGFGQQDSFAQNTAKPSLFGSTSFGNSSFGNTSQTQPFGSGFSQQPQSQPLNRFGTTNPFGLATNTLGSAMGGTMGTPALGSAVGTSAMGNAMPPAGGTSTLGGTGMSLGAANPFGSSGTNALGSGAGSSSAFGTAGSSLFGSSNAFSAPQPAQSFSSTQPAARWGQPAPVYNSFGSTQNTLLGDRSNAMPRTSFPGFGASSGTKDHPYVQRKIREDNGSEVTLVHINSNESYSAKSVDELRSEDYSLNRKPVTTRAAEKPFGFGSTLSADTTQASAPSQFQPFTSTATANPFGTQQPFGNGAAAPQPMFSQPAPVAPAPQLQPAPQFSGFSAQMQPQPVSAPSQPMFSSFSQPMQPFGTPSFVAQQSPQTRIDPSDPFLLKDIKFEKAEKDHIPLSKMFPQPIFKEEPRAQKILLNFRPPRSPAKEKIYTIPSIEDTKHMKEVHNLIVGFEDKGRIEYLDMVNASEVTIPNIQSKIYFSKDSVVVNDPVGVGLNRRARVYVEGVFPYSKSLGDYIRGEQKQFPLKGIQDRFVYGLKNDAVKRFVGYECERGTYVYDVNHF